jgi:hypothetical protein
MIAPHKSNRVKPATQDGRALRRYCRRWKVERSNAWLQNFRRIATRFEMVKFFRTQPSRGRIQADVSGVEEYQQAMDDAYKELERGDEPVRYLVRRKSPDGRTQLKLTYTESCLGSKLIFATQPLATPLGGCQCESRRTVYLLCFFWFLIASCKLFFKLLSSGDRLKVRLYSSTASAHFCCWTNSPARLVWC